MKLRIYLIQCFLLAALFPSYSKVVYDSGYVVNNAGFRIRCAIKSFDLNHNPDQITIKKSIHASEEILEVDSVQEFGIINEVTFKRFVVSIDRSDRDLRYITTNRSPVFKEETLWLRVLVDRKDGLYAYQQGNWVRFFFQETAAGPITQLIYKKYRNASDGTTTINSAFRQQLWNQVNCQKHELSRFEKIRYTQKDLIKVFTEYNDCEYGPSQDKARTLASTKLVLSLRLGANLQRGEYYDNNGAVNDSGGVPLDMRFGPRVGVELEVMPLSQNKWSILFEPNYHYYIVDSKEVDQLFTLKVKYRSIDVNLGIRRYFKVNERLSVFINIIGAYGLTGRSTITKESNWNRNFDEVMEVNNVMNLALGTGLLYKRIHFEYRIHTRKDLLSQRKPEIAHYSQSSFVVGYRLF